jgi:hypothetical protein
VSALLATITQAHATSTSEGFVREHRVLVDRRAAFRSKGSRSGSGETLAAAPPRFEAIDLEVRGETVGADMLAKLIAIAERGCIVHNTLAPGIELTVRRA